MLNQFIGEMYDKAQAEVSSERATWLEIQDLAFKEDSESVKKLTSIVLEAERTAVKLPIIRVAAQDKTAAGKDIKKGETIICDIVSCQEHSQDQANDL